MYYFYIKKANTIQYLYTPYKENDEIYKTDSLEELAVKYQEILDKFPKGDIKVIHELEPEMLVTFTD